MDTLTKEKRSVLMARIKSCRNQSTELKLIALFRAAGIKGWRRHLAIPGKPDFAFRKQRVVVFVDGDFWHGNPRKLRIPKSRVGYWLAKIERNRSRDVEVGLELKKRGWKVIRIWESSLKQDPAGCIDRIASALQVSTLN